MPSNTARRHRTKVFHGLENDALLLRALHNRGGERVFAVLLQRGGETQELLRVETAGGQDIHELGFALRERARLVHDERGDFLQPFERLGVFHEHAFLRAASDADHDGHGRGQAEGARAGDDEDRDGVDDGVRELWLRPKPHPDDEGEHRNRQHHRHEDARDLVGETLNGRAAALGFGNHVHDLPEQRVAADPLGAHDETAGAIDGAARHFVADGLFHRERFAGDHGLFHAGVTFDHHAINGHLVTWNHAQPVADFHLVERDFMIAPRCDLSRRGRCEIEQRFDGAARAAAGTEFEHLTEEHQHNDHRRGFKVDGDLALVLHRVWEQAGHEHRHGAEDECRAHADGDQREHVQVTRHDGAPAAVEERPACPPDHGRGERKLHPA